MRFTGNSRRLFKVLGGSAVLAAACSFSVEAHADGGIPRGYGILFEPGNPSHIMVHSYYWGLFDSRSGPSSWKLLCSQAFGGRALDADAYPTVLAKGGRILVASSFSGLIESDDTCDWSKIDAFDGQPVQVIAPADATGENFLAVTVKGENGGVTSRVYSSADRGDTWTQLKGTIDPDVSIQGIAVAPSDPKRVYAVGVTINGGPRVIEVSTDGGGSFTSLPIGATNQYDPTLPVLISVAGISPVDPDVLFVRVNGSDSPGSNADDELWGSPDGGTTWNRSYLAAGDLPGFTFTPDGKKVLIASPSNGIMEDSIEDALTVNQAAYALVSGNPIWGLAFDGGKLYAGTDDYGMTPPSMLGVSTDGGKSFTPLMTHCDVEFPQCAPNSTMQMACAEQWQRQGGYITDYLNTCSGAGTTGGGGVAAAGGAQGAGGSSAGGAATSSGGSTSSAVAQSTGSAGGAGGATSPPGGPDAGDGVSRVRIDTVRCSVSTFGHGSDPTKWMVALLAFGAGLCRRRRPR